MDSTARLDLPRASSSMDWVRATVGVLGVYASLGAGLLLLAFAAANGLKNVDLNDPARANLAASVFLVGVLPLVAAPLLAAACGMWAGTRTRLSGPGAIAGALGAVLGTLALGILVALGFALGLNAAGVDVARIAWPAGLYMRPGWRATLADVGTGAGLLNLLAVAIVGGLAGAITGALTDRYAFPAWDARTTPRGRYERTRLPRI